MSYINFQNLPTTTTPLSAANLNAIQNIGAIQIYLASDTDVSSDTTQYAKVPLDTQYDISGTQLSFDSTNKAIVVGAGVSKVEVTGFITMDTTNKVTPPNYGIAVRINGSGSNQLYSANTIIEGSYVKIFVKGILSVSQNDKLTLHSRHVTVQNETMPTRGGAGYTSLMARVIY